MRTLRIQNNSGDWWTGLSWGVEQCAAEYHSADELPDVIDGLDLEVHADDQHDFDARYYDGDSLEAEAGVVVTAE